MPEQAKNQQKDRQRFGNSGGISEKRREGENKMFKKIKENKKGFTLVELIVVLVILAILAALLVPALTGYIDRAKKKSIIAETRQCVMAAQTLIDEEYAKQNVGITITAGAVTTGTATVSADAIQKLAEVKGTVGTITRSSDTDTVNKITKLEYTKGGYKCTYEPGGTNNSDGDYNVTKAE